MKWLKKLFWKKKEKLGESFDTKEEVMDFLRDVLGKDWEDIYSIEISQGRARVNKVCSDCSEDCCEK